MRFAQENTGIASLSSRRSCLHLLARGLIGSSLGGLGTAFASSPASAPTNIRAGLQRGALGAMKVALPLVADKYNLAFTQNTFNDSTAVILALQQKQLDWGNLTAQHVIRGIEQGMDLVLVSGYGGGYNVFVAATKLGLAKGDMLAFKELVNRRKASNKVGIGVPTGSIEHLKLISLLTDLKINPEQDVQILNIPFPEHPRALDAGQIDMAMTIPSFGALAIVKGNATLFDHLYGTGPGRWEIGFAVRRDMVKDTPDVVQRIVGASVDAMKLFINDPAKRLDFEKKESSFPPPVIDMEQKDFDRYSYRIALDDLKQTAKEMHQIGWAKKDYSDVVENYVDYSFLEKATGESRQQLMVF